MTTPETEAPAVEKEVVRLPDGRELTYYRFPEQPPRPAAVPATAPGKAGGKER